MTHCLHESLSRVLIILLTPLLCVSCQAVSQTGHRANTKEPGTHPLSVEELETMPLPEARNLLVGKSLEEAKRLLANDECDVRYAWSLTPETEEGKRTEVHGYLYAKRAGIDADFNFYLIIISVEPHYDGPVDDTLPW